jgi:hypothetical protein
MVAEGTGDPYEPLSGRFAGYPPGFLDAIDKATKVMPRDRIQNASDWLELIEQSERGTGQDPAGSHDTRAPGAKSGGILASNMGYLVGAGLVLVFVAIAALWTVLT